MYIINFINNLFIYYHNMCVQIIIGGRRRRVDWTQTEEQVSGKAGEKLLFIIKTFANARMKLT